MASVEVSGVVERLTDAAVLLSVGASGASAWLPLSQIELVEGALEEDADVTLSVPQWLAEKRGFL